MFIMFLSRSASYSTLLHFSECLLMMMELIFKKYLQQKYLFYSFDDFFSKQRISVLVANHQKVKLEVF